MSEHRKKITIRVSSQTAYHLEAEAERLGISPGRVVDERRGRPNSVEKCVEFVENTTKSKQISLKS